MDWIVDTKCGSFEGKRLKKIVKEIIEYYGNEDVETPQVTAIFAYPSDDRAKEMPEKIVSAVQDKLDDKIRKWRKSADEERQGWEGLKSDYLEMAL